MSYFADINIRSSGLSAYVMMLVFVLLLFLLLLLIVSPALVAAAIARKQAEKTLNRRVKTIIAQYDPPHELTPAEAGLLYDMRCGQEEIMATLFNLEQRQVIKILNEQSVQITNLSAYAKLLEYEKIAVRIAKGETDDVSKLTSITHSYVDAKTGAEKKLKLPLLTKNTRYAFTHAVQEALKSRGIKMGNYYRTFGIRATILAFILSLIPLLEVATPGTLNGVKYPAWSGDAIISGVITTFTLTIFLFPVYLLVAFLIILMWTKIAGRYWLNSKQARAFWPELEGYKLYLKQVELENIQFESAQLSQDFVTKTLPYAIVFGLDTKWKQWLLNRSNG